MSRETKAKRAAIPSATEIDVAPTGYQPSKAQLEEEVTMPNLSLEQVRAAFMRPFRLVRAAPKAKRR